MPAATGYSLSGPAAGPVNVASAAFTVTLTPAGGTAAATTITPAGVLGGTFTPATVSLSTATPSATFTLTDTAQGADTVSTTNNGGLTDPGSLSFLSSPAVAGMYALSGDAVLPNVTASLAVTPNTYAPILVTITSCPGKITAASLMVKPVATTATALLTRAGLIVDPGTVAANGTFVAKVLFNLAEADTNLMYPSTLPYSLNVQATATAGGTSRTIQAVENAQWISRVGGPVG